MSPPKKKMRVDQLAVERGLFQSRTQAQAAIMAGELFSEEELLAKPGHLVAHDIPMSFKSRRSRYVGRGGYKMEGALKDFHLDVTDYNCIDVGSSTGGFTDCLLQHGAKQVTCIDVGKGQLDYQLRQDQRVNVLEGINARHMQPEQFSEKYDLAVIDVSFISLTKVLPAVAQLVQERKGKVLALIKPQFEVGPAAIGKGGIVRDKQARDLAVLHVVDCLAVCHLKKLGVKSCCLKGTDGNQEFFLLAERNL
jgi:23S rRNA (cytidine1920-2'-O)/16S rRNA (cytidine1409-2'-O)-methyltransferase